MSHFYLADGTPFYTVIGANGKERPATLRDARKVNAAPSVTTINGQLAKPMLVHWLQTRLLETVEVNQDLIGLHTKWKEQVIGISAENNSSYSKEGTRVHDALELFFKEGLLNVENEVMLRPVIDYITGLYPEAVFEAEPSFNTEGYGGKIDLVVHHKDGVTIIDFKTKQGGLDKLQKAAYDDYAMQLAAYGAAYENVTTYMNIFISVTDRGVFHPHIWPAEKIATSLKMFKNLKDFWYLAHNYEIN